MWLEDWWHVMVEEERLLRERQYELNKTSLPLLAAMSRTPWVLDWPRFRKDFYVRFGSVYGLKVKQ